VHLRAASLAGFVLAALAWLPRPATSQQAPRPLTLEEARAAARRVSPDLAAARAAVDAASARARQAGAPTNPTVSYAYEETSAGGQRNSQSIAALEQPLELTGVRGARHDAARLRQEAAEADLRAAEGQVGFEVTRAYALAQAADERMALADRAATAFDRAQRVTGARLVAGDVSGYEARRIRLEGARYAALRAEAALARGDDALASRIPGDLFAFAQLVGELLLDRRAIERGGEEDARRAGVAIEGGDGEKGLCRLSIGRRQEGAAAAGQPELSDGVAARLSDAIGIGQRDDLA